MRRPLRRRGCLPCCRPCPCAGERARRRDGGRQRTGAEVVEGGVGVALCVGEEGVPWLNDAQAVERAVGNVDDTGWGDDVCSIALYADGWSQMPCDAAQMNVTNKANRLFFIFGDSVSLKLHCRNLCLCSDDTTYATVGLKISSPRGIAVGFKTDAIDFPEELIPPGILDIFVTLQRGNLIRAFCVIATVAVWLITLVLLLLMFTAVIFGFRQRGEVLVVPVATVFAFTQLRNSMPGAPAGFGDVLDFVGLLPCLGILSVSAALTLGAFILTDPTETPHALTMDLLYEAFPFINRKRAREIERESLQASDDVNRGA